jgi:hypothetical protein
MMDGEFGVSHRVFENSQQMAACWQCVTASAGYPTVAIELAKCGAGGADWNNKFSIHIAKKELHAVASVLLGFSESFEAKFHGAKRNKSYELRRDASSLRITISDAGPKKTIQIGLDSAFWLATFVVGAIVKNAPPGTPESMIIPLIQRTQPSISKTIGA